jgi:nucleoside 2-deoxyribosyltransferase
MEGMAIPFPPSLLDSYPPQLVLRRCEKMKKVYLAGLISTECLESLRWREEAAGILGAVTLPGKPLEILTPMRGKQNLCASSKDGGITTETNTSKDIILRDYLDVQNADVVLMNLNLFGSKRPLVGTLYELAWCWANHKRVVAICGEDDYLMHNHPFIKESVAHYFSNVKDACMYIREQQ